MKPIFAAIIGLFTLSNLWAGENIPDAKTLMEKNFLVSKVSGFSGAVNMTLIDAKGQERSRKLAIWSKLKKNSTDAEVLLRFEQPADIKDTGFLQIENASADDDIWIYLPALGKTRRLVANNKKDSFFGTDFSYGDILLPPVNKYTYSYSKDEIVEGKNCHLVEAIPINDQVRNESGYAKKRVWLDAENSIERKVEYYDAAGNLLKTQTVFDAQLIEPANHRWIAMRREMINHQTQHKTLYTFEKITLDTELADNIFTSNSLER